MNSESTQDQSINPLPVSIDELIKQTTRESMPIFTSEQTQAMARLDQATAQNQWLTSDVTDIMGVVAGVKPSTLIRESDQTVLFAREFGLAHYEVPDRNLMTISRSEDLARALAGAFSDFWAGADDTATNQKIGKMLGYPETSTEYFIRRSPTIDMPIDEQLPIIEPVELANTVRQHFHQLILSPDHWREELEVYVIPLEAAVREFAPLTYKQLERHARKTRVAAALGRLIGRQQPTRFNERDIAVTYVE